MKQGKQTSYELCMATTLQYNDALSAAHRHSGSGTARGVCSLKESLNKSLQSLKSLESLEKGLHPLGTL